MDQYFESQFKKLNDLRKELEVYTEALKQKELNPIVERDLIYASMSIKNKIHEVRTSLEHGTETLQG